MPPNKRTMKHLSYGVETPLDILKKLQWDAKKLSQSPHPYDVFNFILTAAVLAEWTQKYYSSKTLADPFSAPNKENKNWTIPTKSADWIQDTSCLPNRHCDFKHHIANVLSICAHTANASKHFNWNDEGNISSIGEKAPIANWYQYFFTSRKPDLYIQYDGENYGLQQIKEILTQFYTGLIEYLENLKINEESN